MDRIIGMTKIQLIEDCLATEKFAGQTHWRGSLEWQRVRGFRTYSETELSPAGAAALEKHRRGEPYGLELTEFTHHDSTIFSTLALSSTKVL